MLLLEISGFETFIGQIVALITFFAFPAIQYYLLKRLSKKHGNPQLWYLPAYGFRLVISNIPNKRTLSDLKYKTIIRETVSANSGSSVDTYIDTILTKNEEFFLFGNYDQILLSFKINSNDENSLVFVHTDKLGNTLKEIPLQNFEVISDYMVNIENLLNFDVKVAKRVVINSETLYKHWASVMSKKQEQFLSVDAVFDVG